MARISWLLAFLFFCGIPAHAEEKQPLPAPLHRQVLVFVPAYEGSALYDVQQAEPGQSAPCVWGSIDGIRKQKYYYAIRMPNALVARPMLRAGPIDVYDTFVKSISRWHEESPGFHPYTRDRDFFFFAYDWRQDMATVTAPQLAHALRNYADQRAIYAGDNPEKTTFIIVAHSMGGLVVRTMLSQNPDLASRIDRLYMVGTPNLGCVKAIKTLLVGPGGLKESDLDFPGSLIKLLPNDVSALTTKLVAITRPSLYELMPLGDPQWESIDANGVSRRISPVDLLSVGTWKPFWPSAEAERRDFLIPWLSFFSGGPGEPVERADWEFCQDPHYLDLQKILAQVRDWRQHLGTLSATDRLLTRPGESSRLRLVIGRGGKTPTGLISEGQGDATTVRYTYSSVADGDETVTVESALGDLKNPGLVYSLQKVTHGQLINSGEFLHYFIDDSSKVVSTLPNAGRPDVPAVLP